MRRLDAHGAHQVMNPLAVYREVLAFQLDRHLARNVVRRFQVLLINQVHQIKILLTVLTRDEIHRRAAQLEWLALAYTAEFWMTPLDHR